jgi:predicted O-linked N-acetylglucosamine transferase (SPINDLY family)
VRVSANATVVLPLHADADTAMAEVAAKARADGVDIAVDLQGNTLHTSLGIFAHRAAPIQVSYLGFPGSTGATFMDYLVTDATVVSREFRAAYLERQLVMPNSYLPSGRRQIASTKWTRELAGLPEDSFVFCCFNNSFKITPLEFDIWMEVLRQVRGSVLWLVGHNPKVERNLRKEADRRGVNPTRLRFAPRVPLDEYLARQQLADLALDTIIYTGHSTASDALWAGVPLITMLGKGFPARVGASLLRAVGLPELITRDAREYLSLALELASDAERLSGIRERLAEQRETAPLFDIDLYARHIEEGFDAAFSRLVRGKPPADIFIAARNNP